MKIHNPATGAVLADVAADNAKAVRAKYDRARAAQPRWAARPMARRLAAMRAFRGELLTRVEALARTLSEEVGKPIRQARNEVNGLTARLDLSAAHVREALRAGVKLVCSTDSHGVERFANMRFAVHTARRGGATGADVLNTRPLAALLRT